MWPDLFKRKQKPIAPLQRTQATAETPDVLLRRLHWTILRPIATSLWGDERSLFRGPGMELSEIRQYQPGDDIRFIDWNITARTDYPMIREAQLERAVDVWFLLDLSASTHWGTANCLKQDRSIEFTAIAGQVLNRNGNRLGALPFADRPLQILPPSAGRRHLLRLLAYIREQAVDIHAGSTDLLAALTQADAIVRRRSVIVVISDFLVAEGWQGTLSKLAKRHEVIAVRIHDPRESDLPDVGLVTFEDPETGKQLLVDTGDRKLRERFQLAAERQAETLRVDLLKCGVDPLFLSTHEELLPAFVRFLHTRQLQKGKRKHLH